MGFVQSIDSSGRDQSKGTGNDTKGGASTGAARFDAVGEFAQAAAFASQSKVPEVMSSLGKLPSDLVKSSFQPFQMLSNKSRAFS